MATKIAPPMKWAERKEVILLTIDVVGVSAADAKVSLDASGKLSFAWKNYQAEIELLKEVDPEKSKWGFNDRAVHLSITKKVPEYWNKLLKQSAKPKWLSVDWERWKDEDEEAEPASGQDFADLGGGNGFDFNSMAGMPGMPGMEGMGEGGHDSDDDEMPDLEGDAGHVPPPPTATTATTAETQPTATEQKKPETEEEKKEKKPENAAPTAETK